MATAAQEGDQKILVIEPFYGGSHKKLIDVICLGLPKNMCLLITMRAKKWHWRARTAALYVSTQIPQRHCFKVLFCTSVLPLAELLGIRPDLANLYKVVYFHENQLEFPVQVTKERDFQYGFNEILTCIAADKVLFNSFYNQDSFLSHIDRHLKLQPDYRSKGIDYSIQSKCRVIYYPMDLHTIDTYLSTCPKIHRETLHIIWPHRWEFDKNPDSFCRVLSRLEDNGLNFKVSILGESFSKKPEVFTELSNKFKSKLINCGFVDSPFEYYSILSNADVVVSTAIHEFFGVAVLEAVYCGCIPVVPNRLAYKELYASEVDEVYNTEEELYDILANLCSQKQNDLLNKNYKHIALPYESHRWLTKLMEVLEFNVDSE